MARRLGNGEATPSRTDTKSHRHRVARRVSPLPPCAGGSLLPPPTDARREQRGGVCARRARARRAGRRCPPRRRDRQPGDTGDKTAKKSAGVGAAPRRGPAGRAFPATPAAASAAGRVSRQEGISGGFERRRRRREGGPPTRGVPANRVVPRSRARPGGGARRPPWRGSCRGRRRRHVAPPLNAAAVAAGTCACERQRRRWASNQRAKRKWVDEGGRSQRAKRQWVGEGRGGGSRRTVPSQSGGGERPVPSRCGGGERRQGWPSRRAATKAVTVAVCG